MRRSPAGRIPGAAPSSGASLPVSDYARWVATAVDGDSSSLDFVADLDTSDGSSVVVDDSAAWVTDVAGWGYAVAKVTVNGRYAISRAAVAAEGESWLPPQFFDPTGAPVPPLGNTTRLGGFAVGGGELAGSSSVTVYLPAGTHIDTPGAPATATLLELLIERVD